MISRTNQTGQSVGVRKEDRLDMPSNNHFAGGPQSKTASIFKGFRRVAGNTYINLSSKDMWKVQGGKLIRLTGIEVDNGETLTVTVNEDEDDFGF